jgi:hypothetical protein
MAFILIIAIDIEIGIFCVTHLLSEGCVFQVINGLIVATRMSSLYHKFIHKVPIDKNIFISQNARNYEFNFILSRINSQKGLHSVISMI